MNIDKRNFSNFNDKKSFPGKIDTATNEYHFPALFHIDSSGNTRKWEIKIRLVKGSPKKYGIDWDLLIDDTVPIKKKYLDNEEIPDGTISQVWAEVGVIGGKQTRHAPSYPEIKNAGKSNERNVFEQGLVDARTLYLKKIENGLQTASNFKKEKIYKKDKLEKNIKYFPMLVRKFQDEKDHLEYPLYVQPKLDGSRCIAFLNKTPKKNPTIENVIMYSRQKKNFSGFDDIKEELLPALIDMWDFDKNESVYIDGELYKHGMSLQTISGAVRNPNRSEMPEYKGIKFWVFDAFYPHRLNLTFNDRIYILEDIFNSLGHPKHIIHVPTIMAISEANQEKLYKQYLNKKYEGIILRNISSLYLTHPTKNSMTIRSKYVLKRKMTYSDEFEVVDFDQGKKGRDKEAIMWILKTHGTNKLFSATPKNITYEERYKLYKDAMVDNKKGFKNKFKGRMMTVEYEDLSKDEIPLRAKSIGFREHI
jgi:ATP-dependent DNA ligase